MNKYKIYRNTNVLMENVSEFDNLGEAVLYCIENTEGYDPVCDGDNNYEGCGNNFRYEIYEGHPIVIDENGDATDMKESVYETQWYYC